MFIPSSSSVGGLGIQRRLVALLASIACQIACAAAPASAEQPPAIATSAKVLRYSARVLQAYDRDHSGRLESPEWPALREEPKQADLNGDGVIALEELAQRISRYGARRRIQLKSSDPVTTQPGPLLPATAGQETSAALDPQNVPLTPGDPRTANRTFFIPRTLLPQGVPDWFIDRDVNGDGQLTISEFAEHGGRAEMHQFASLDSNGDGLVTASEYAKTSKDQPASEVK
jgi:hypothetical protein